SKGFWAVLDQGMFSVANFGANILLAKWMSKAQYGAFAVAFALFLLLGTFHNALIIEPMLVFGNDRYGKRLKRYLGALLYGHAAVTLIGAALLAGAGLVAARVFRAPELGMALVAMGAAAPFM